MKTRIQSILIVLTFLFLGLLPQMQAVSPAPDGCYPGFTTAEGCNALKFVGSGAGNTGVGWYSLYSVGGGNYNTGVGAGTLVLNNGDSNTAVGTAAMLLNTGGTQNVAVGTDALVYNDGGDDNNAVGYFALFNNIDGTANSAFGTEALFKNIHGDSNTAIGNGALFNNDSTGAGLGNENTAVGALALFNNTDGDSNTAIGLDALYSNDTGSGNTAIGYRALYSNTEGLNTATGYQAMSNNTTGFSNTADGAFALMNNIAGEQNTAVGIGALQHNNNDFNTAVGAGALGANTAGFRNTAVGFEALADLTSGSDNIAIGLDAGSNLTSGEVGNIDIDNSGVPGENNTTRIGTLQSRTFIQGIHNAVVTGTSVVVSAAGQLGLAPSSQRFKTAMKRMDQASEAILALKPVTFRYKKEIDPAAMPQFGLVAEEVEKVNPDLVTRDAEGKPYTVRYDAVNAMLLNEFLKEHRAFVEEQHKVAQQQKEIDTLKAELKEQRSLIQKVSDKVELKRSTPQVVANK